jgi:hypothetical protein
MANDYRQENCQTFFGVPSRVRFGPKDLRRKTAVDNSTTVTWPHSEKKWYFNLIIIFGGIFSSGEQKRVFRADRVGLSDEKKETCKKKKALSREEKK